MIPARMMKSMTNMRKRIIIKMRKKLSQPEKDEHNDNDIHDEEATDDINEAEDNNDDK